jgi:hypothetical protein
MSDTPLGQIIFDDKTWRTLVPAFKDPVAYPTVILEMYFNNAACFIETCDVGLLSCSFSGSSRLLGLYLMASHLLATTQMVCDNDGAPLGIVIEGQVDKVRVTLKPPPATDMFQYWLSTTPYGQQLLALLKVQSVGGFYIGGSPQRSAFRGTFGPGISGRRGNW